MLVVVRSVVDVVVVVVVEDAKENYTRGLLAFLGKGGIVLGGRSGGAREQETERFSVWRETESESRAGQRAVEKIDFSIIM